MRTDRFQPSGPVADPPRRDPPWIELLRSVPLAMLLGGLGVVFGWGVRYATFTSTSEATIERIARLEAAESKDMASLRADLTDRIERTENTVNLRFDAGDKRGDARMAMLATKFDNADKRGESLLDAMNQLNLRLTRMEALREFNAANPGGKK